MQDNSDGIGEADLLTAISDFSCPGNRDIEYLKWNPNKFLIESPLYLCYTLYKFNNFTIDICLPPCYYRYRHKIEWSLPDSVQVRRQIDSYQFREISVPDHQFILQLTKKGGSKWQKQGKTGNFLSGMANTGRFSWGLH